MILRSLYIRSRLFAVLGVLLVLFVVSYAVPIIYPAMAGITIGVVAVMVTDVLLLYMRRKPVSVTRDVEEMLSMGDLNRVKIRVRNDNGVIPYSILVKDEAPYQLQMRDLSLKGRCGRGQVLELEYFIRPTERGVFHFGKVNTFLGSPIGLFSRRIQGAEEFDAKAYPSIFQMKQFELEVFSRHQQLGVHRIRRLGQTNEFEQIKAYVQGDDIRSINWKATSRMNELMVNQYEDRKSQPIYAVIDKGRAMRMPFNGLTLLDHSINSALAILNIAHRKGDHPGLFTFANKIGDHLPASPGGNQVRKILDVLYRQRTNFLDSNYELLYQGVRKQMGQRGLMLLYTNFESESAMRRALPMLRGLNKQHLLVVTLFINTEVEQAVHQDCHSLSEVYLQGVAEKFMYEKRQMANELRRYGIQVILTKTSELSVNVINKYLELKSRGLI